MPLFFFSRCSFSFPHLLLQFSVYFCLCLFSFLFFLSPLFDSFILYNLLFSFMFFLTTIACIFFFSFFFILKNFSSSFLFLSSFLLLNLFLSLVLSDPVCTFRFYFLLYFLYILLHHVCTVFLSGFHFFISIPQPSFPFHINFVNFILLSFISRLYIYLFILPFFVNMSFSGFFMQIARPSWSQFNQEITMISFIELH